MSHGHGCGNTLSARTGCIRSQSSFEEPGMRTFRLLLFVPVVFALALTPTGQF